MRTRFLGLLGFVSGAWLIISGCGSQAAPSAAAGQGGAASAKAATKVNIDEIFPPDTGRDVILQNCTNCHSIAPIALARMSPGEWTTHRLNHRERVPGISDAQADQVWAYLSKHMVPGRPVPDLPEDLLQAWTSY